MDTLIKYNKEFVFESVILVNLFILAINKRAKEKRLIKQKKEKRLIKQEKRLIKQDKRAQVADYTGKDRISLRRG